MNFSVVTLLPSILLRVKEISAFGIIYCHPKLSPSRKNQNLPPQLSVQIIQRIDLTAVYQNLKMDMRSRADTGVTGKSNLVTL